MPPEYSDRAHAIASKALGRPLEERETHILSVCGNNTDLLAEVRGLLQTPGDAPTEFLEPDAEDRCSKSDLDATIAADGSGRKSGKAATPVDDTTESGREESESPGLLRPIKTADLHPERSEYLTEHEGDIIGPYQLLKPLGEGGMGQVFVAEQKEPFHRKLALKIIKPGMDSKEVLARFDAERQALALMDHPWIARVFDAGISPSGRPFFVMELVDGVPITDYCDNFKLSIPQRLQLFMKVCEAIQHAHQRGIIHRDLKPSNILVDNNDGAPIPKVIDFGLAKAVNRELTIRSMATQVGDLLGTPQYMSPEQALGNVGEIDTRSDVYSLGIVLYELLTGEPPISREEIQEAGILGVARLLDESEPERPSTKLKTTENAATTVAEKRNTDLTRLDRCLRRELDWVALKCLEKEKDRRYESASSLGRDIKRHLNDEVVEARPPSRSYRIRKIVKRNRGAFAATGIVLLSILAGSGIAVWQAIEAKKAQQETAEALMSERATRKRMLARLYDLVSLERITQSIVFNDPHRYVATNSEAATLPDEEVSAALFLSRNELVLARGSELCFFNSENREETHRFQLGEKIIALFSSPTGDYFFAVARGFGQVRQSKIYRIPAAKGDYIECVFDCKDIKGLAGPVAFARGQNQGEVLIAFGYLGSGHLGFERDLPGNSEQSLDYGGLEKPKTIAVFSFDVDSRKITLVSTAENFGQGEWRHLHETVSQKFPTFRWSNMDLDAEKYEKILTTAPPELKSDWLPLANWQDEMVLIAPKHPSGENSIEVAKDEKVPAERLRIYDAKAAKLIEFSQLKTSRDALDLSDRLIDYSVIDARTLDHLSPPTLAGLKPTHQVYAAFWSPDPCDYIKLIRFDLTGLNNAGDRGDFLRSAAIRMYTEGALVRTIHPPKEFTRTAGPGSTLYVGLDGDAIFYVGRFRSFEGVLVYDGHTGEVLYELNSDTLGLSGSNSIGTSFMERNDCLLAAIDRGLLRVWRNSDGEWVHSLEKHQ